MAASDLKSMGCEPCRKGAPAVQPEEIEELSRQIPKWNVVKEKGVPKLVRTFEFGNFREALGFTDRVGRIAEEHDHHPILTTEWGKVTVVWYTHKIRALHKNDFVMAAKTDELYGK